VLAFAGFGALCLLFEAYLLSAWVISGRAVPTPDGSSPIPRHLVVSARIWESAGVLCLGYFILHFVVRGWRRDRQVTLDGIFVISFLLLYWQDPLGDYLQPFATYNTVFLNYGSWLGNVPGVFWPHSNLLAEPIIWMAPVYVYALFGGVLLANKLMAKARRRWPHLGVGRMVALTIAAFWIMDLILEVAFVRLGFYTFGGAIRWMSLFPGTWYQFPLYETALWGTTWGLMACVRFFVNDRGETIAERGVSSIRTTPFRRDALRLLAVSGLLNAMFLIGYNIPIQWFALHADSWPDSVQSRSYFTNQLCGPGTEYACPGPRVPIPRPDSVHLDPQGNTVAPSR
jgi:hypothetical protein